MLDSAEFFQQVFNGFALSNPFTGALLAFRLLAGKGYDLLGPVGGCRLGEIMTLQWAHVDIKARELQLLDSKTGAKIVHFGKMAADVLKGIEKLDDNPCVITGKRPGSHLTDLQHPWRRIRAKAKLDDVRIHDLRHSYASGALALGEGLPMIGKLLGHTQVQTTARYAHLANDPVKTAGSKVSDMIGAAMRGKTEKPNSQGRKRPAKRTHTRQSQKDIPVQVLGP